MTDIEKLLATRERLFKTGWHKGSLGREDGPNCLVGGIAHSSPNGMETVFCSHSVYSFLAENINLDSTWNNKDLWKVEYFNDQELTTFDDIVDLIDRTIKTLEQHD